MLIDIGKINNKIFTLDLDTLIETRGLIQSRSGGGKSYLIRKLIEASHGKIQQVIIDLEGEFSSLREHYDFIIAGQNGDIPVHVKTAALMAKEILKLNASVIIDLSEQKSHDRIKFVRLFLESLVGAPKNLWHPLMVIIDEAHIFCPEKGQAESASAVIDLATRGRKRGFCLIAATQRLSKLHKDCAAELGNKFIGGTTVDIDRKRGADELGFSKKEDVLSLRILEPGEFFVYGPALRISGKKVIDIPKILVGKVKSNHPKVGSRQSIIAPPAKGKVLKLIATLSTLPEQADKKAKELSDYKTENIQLKRQLIESKKNKPEQVRCNHEGLLKGIKNNQAVVKVDVSNFMLRIKKIKDDISNSIIDLNQIAKKIDYKFDLKFDVSKINTTPHIIKKTSVHVGDSDMKHQVEQLDQVTAPQLKILNALFTLHNLGIDKVNKVPLGYMSGYSPKGGGYNNYLGQLKSKGLIEYPSPGLIKLNPAGESLCDDPVVITDVSELHDFFYQVIEKKAKPLGKILRHIVSVFPDDLSKEELAEATGYSSNGGGFNNYLGKLKNTFQVIDYPSSGRVIANEEIMFPEGL